MKRKIIALAIIVAFAMTSLTALASEDEEMPTLDTEYGIYKLLGCDFFTSEDDNIIIVFSEYENTTDENTDAGMEYYIEAFQDGVSLDSAYFSSSAYDISSSEWPDAKSSSTELQPGGSIVYYKAFKLSGDSDVDIEISTLWGWGDDEVTASYTFECGESVASSAGNSEDTSEDYETMYYELLDEYEQLKADYDALTGIS